MKLEGRTVLITGGSAGIGYEMTKQLLARHNTVLITGRNERRLREAQSALPDVHVFRSDASRPDQIETLREHVLREFPDLDTLINNAGIMRNLNLNDLRSPTDITQEVDTSLTGPIHMVQRFLPHLKTKPNALIVNVSSGLAFVPFPLSPIYSAAKAGLHAFTRCPRAASQLGCDCGGTRPSWSGDAVISCGVRKRDEEPERDGRRGARGESIRRNRSR